MRRTPRTPSRRFSRTTMVRWRFCDPPGDDDLRRGEEVCGGLGALRGASDQLAHRGLEGRGATFLGGIGRDRGGHGLDLWLDPGGNEDAGDELLHVFDVAAVVGGVV